jgi:CBS-domain-containing membrane protein
MGVAVGLTIVLMQLLRCVHPPAGAVALLGVLASAKPAFVVTPVFLDSLLLAGITILFSRMAPDRAYPKHWF